MSEGVVDVLWSSAAVDPALSGHNVNGGLVIWFPIPGLHLDLNPACWANRLSRRCTRSYSAVLAHTDRVEYPSRSDAQMRGMPFLVRWACCTLDARARWSGLTHGRMRGDSVNGTACCLSHCNHHIMRPFGLIPTHHVTQWLGAVR